MAKKRFSASDMRDFYYFFIAAREKSICEAARLLFISQPPLSRTISRLEDRLGVRLFSRGNMGVSLTDSGKRFFATIAPLMEHMENTFTTLDKWVDAHRKACRVGFTTAFEQGIFRDAEMALKNWGEMEFSRGDSPHLAQAVGKGNLDAAFVALPLHAPGAHIRALRHEEKLLGVLPLEWAKNYGECPRLRDMADKPLFWFARGKNQDFFDYMKSIFAHAQYKPVFIEEPPGHDLLLAAIAACEGYALLPASFAIMQRPGICYVEFAESFLMKIKLGLVQREDNSSMHFDELLEVTKFENMKEETCRKIIASFADNVME